MRCVVCDFSDGEAKSLYHTGIVEPKGSKKRYVFYDKYRGEEICNFCHTPSVKHIF